MSEFNDPASELRDRLLLDQTERWQRGERFLVEAYLQEHPALQADRDVLLDLIYHEILLREDRGEAPQLAEYLERFPHLSEPLTSQFRMHSFFGRKTPALPPATTGRASWSVPGYDILGELGRGGMGVVYKACQTRLDRVVALKMILAGPHADPLELARFRTEAEAVARLAHPNIVQIYEVGEQEGQPYFSLEFVDGGSLAGRLRGSPLPARAAARLTEVLARALHVAHQHNIIHRDLKPDNVLLAGGRDTPIELCTPKLTDFGLAKKLDDDGQTQSGALVGTPSYMAPEQARPGSADIGPVTDVHGLGALLYELLTGRPPFQGVTLLDTLDQVRTKDPVPPAQSQPRVPRDLETICLKCLRKEPQRRYPSALALADDLRRFLAGEPITARPVSRTERVWRWCRRNPAPAAALVLLLLALGGVAWAAHQSVKATEARVAGAEAQATASEARTSAVQARADRDRKERERAEAEARALRHETLPLIERAAILREQGFHQAAALHLARALPNNDDPRVRAQWMADAQRSLSPVETSSRRFFAGVLAYSPDGQQLLAGDFASGAIHILRSSDGTEAMVLKGHPRRNDFDRGISAVRGLAFSPDKPGELLSAGLDGAIRVWDRLRGVELRHSAPDPDAPLLTLAIEPGPGLRLATGDTKGTLTWWDEDTLRKVKEVRGAHIPFVNSVRYRPDGQQLASTGPDGVVRLWDRDGRRMAELVPPGWKAGDESQGMFTLAYSPDGRQILAGCRDGRIYFWDVATGQFSRQLEAIDPRMKGMKPVRALAYTPSGRLVSAGADGFVREWDMEKGEMVGPRERRHESKVFDSSMVFALAVRPDGQELASCGLDCTLRLWDAQTGTARTPLEGGPLSIQDVLGRKHKVSAYCAAKHLLITANGDGDAYLRSWDTRTLREQQTYGGLAPLDSPLGEAPRLTALAIHPDGGRFVAAEPSGTLVWWETAADKPLFSSAASHRRRPPAALARWARQFRWDAEVVKEIEQGSLSWFTVTALAWSHKNNRVASAGVDGMLRLWDPQTGKLLAEWPEEEPEPAALPTGVRKEDAERLEAARLLDSLMGVRELRQDVLLFDGTGTHLITAGRDNLIRLWSLSEPRDVKLLRGHVRRVNAAALGPDGQVLASGSEDGLIILWDLQRRVQKQIITLKPLLSPDLSRIPVALNEREREVMEVLLRDQYAGVRSLAFSPDGHWLAAVLQDGSVSLVDTETGAVAYRGVGHETDACGKSLVTAYFTREGELITVGGDETVRRWDLPAWSKGRQEIYPYYLSGALTRSSEGSGNVVLIGNGTVLQWVAPAGRWQTEWNGLNDPVKALGAGRPDGRVVLGTQSGRALVFDLKAGKVVAEFRGPDGQRKPRDLEPPLKRLGLELLRLAGGQPAPGPPITSVAVQTHGPLAASSWEDGSVDLWDLDKPDREPRRLPPFRRPVAALAFAPRGRELAVAYADGTLRLWDLVAGAWQSDNRNLVGPSNPTGFCYSPDGRHLVQTGYAPAVVVWDLAAGTHVTLSGHLPVSAGETKAISVPAAAYSPQGEWLATGGLDGNIRLWDAGNGYRPVAVLSTVPIRRELGLEELATVLPGLSSARSPSAPSWPGALQSVAFSPDGNQLLAVLINSNIRVYDMQPILDKVREPARDLLAETERLTSLRLEGDRPVPAPRVPLVRGGASLRPTFQQDPIELFARHSRIMTDLLQTGRHQEARDAWRSLLREPGVPELVKREVRVSLAFAHANLGEFEQARAELRQANQNHVIAHGTQAMIHGLEARYQDASAVFDNALKEPGLLPEADYFLRLLRVEGYVLLEEPARAEAEVEGILATKNAPDYLRPNVRILRGKLLTLQWRFPEARAEFEKVLATPGLFEPIPNLARNALAALHLATGETDKARAEIDRLLKANAGDAGALVGLVELYRQQRQFNRAVKQIEENLATPDLALHVKTMRIRLAQVSGETGEFDRAEAELARVLGPDPDNPAALAIRAELDILRGKDLERSEAILKKLCASQPDNLRLRAMSAWVQAGPGQAEKALPILEELATNEVLARDPIFFDHLGDVYARAKRPDKAREAWQKALQVFPKTTEPGDRRKAAIEGKLASRER
jgi:WD40 repeat protein/tetratricopeptide (TPR) repeat protein